MFHVAARYHGGVARVNECRHASPGLCVAPHAPPHTLGGARMRGGTVQQGMRHERAADLPMRPAPLAGCLHRKRRGHVHDVHRPVRSTLRRTAHAPLAARLLARAQFSAIWITLSVGNVDNVVGWQCG